MATRFHHAGFASALALSACTTLGPMPATTGASVLPAERTGGELQLGWVPGYYLSSAVNESGKGASIGQAALMLDPGDLVGLPGLMVGGRYVGKSDSGAYPEPMVGYRTFVDPEERAAVGGVAYGTYAHGADHGASYKATRAGAELGVDARVTPQSRWAELHLLGSLSATGLSANGQYCLDSNGKYGVDCPDMDAHPTNANVAGVYPAGTGGISLVAGRHLAGIFHGAKATLSGAVGTFPTLVGGAQTSTRAYASAGLTFAIAFGARASSDAAPAAQGGASGGAGSTPEYAAPTPTSTPATVPEQTPGSYPATPGATP